MELIVFVIFAVGCVWLWESHKVIAVFLILMGIGLVAAFVMMIRGNARLAKLEQERLERVKQSMLSRMGIVNGLQAAHVCLAIDLSTGICVSSDVSKLGVLLHADAELMLLPHTSSSTWGTTKPPASKEMRVLIR